MFTHFKATESIKLKETRSRWQDKNWHLISQAKVRMPENFQSTPGLPDFNKDLAFSNLISNFYIFRHQIKGAPFAVLQ